MAFVLAYSTNNQIAVAGNSVIPASLVGQVKLMESFLYSLSAQVYAGYKGTTDFGLTLVKILIRAYRLTVGRHTPKCGKFGSIPSEPFLDNRPLENLMYKLYVTFNAMVANVIEFDSKLMANLAYDRLKNTLYVSVVKLY